MEPCTVDLKELERVITFFNTKMGCGNVSLTLHERGHIIITGHSSSGETARVTLYNIDTAKMAEITRTERF